MSGSKINVAKQAIEFLHRKLSSEMILGIGTGTTVNFFIEELKAYKHLFKGAVSSSERSTALLKEAGIIVYDLNNIREIAFYIDGADEVADDKSLIKGGGGAHTREKIVASASDHFICIVDESKLVKQLGEFPLPIEVIPESRSLVSRKIVSMGGTPIYRQSFITDQGNQIIDVKGLDLSDSLEMEKTLNSIAGVVDNGIFAINKPKTVFVA
jgi:ribose 5-phosphate isomerase A